MNESELPTTGEPETGALNTEQAAELELARWFVLSVLRHSAAAQWTDPADSGLTLAEQRSLAASFLRSSSAKQSLMLVLRSQAVQKRLVNFGRNKDVAKLQLVNTTKAFRHALAMLYQVGILSSAESVESTESPVNEEQHRNENLNVPQSNSLRRATRRSVPGQASANDRQSSLSSAASASSDRDTSLSEAEFNTLQEALTSNRPTRVRRRYLPRLNSNQFSLHYGLLAGVIFFGLVNWLFF